MRLLSSGDACEILKLAPNTLDAWCRKDVIEPVEGGNGLGNHRRFTMMQVVGLALALELRKAPRGCALTYLSMVVEAVGNLSEEELLEQFDRGLTRLMLVHKGMAVLDGPRADSEGDLQSAYRYVKGRAEKIETRLQYHRGGRTRGLAGSGIE